LHWLLRTRLHSGTFAWEFVFYATFGVVVTSSVAVAGVLLVFSFLIIPAAIGVLYADAIGRQLAIGWIAGTLTSALGLAASFLFDLPTGATMVCMFGASLAVAGLIYPFLRGDPGLAARRAGNALRWGGAALLAGSALLLLLAPRADQPLLDAVEHVVPALRASYLTATEAATYEDARRFAERYRDEAERLNAIEARSRAQGAAIPDDVVAKMSSFVRSYSEMRRGEEFVMREVRSRARERLRWFAGPLMLVLGLLIAPGTVAAMRRRLGRRAVVSS
jgi:zinc/manganese transport system permease protein